MPFEPHIVPSAFRHGVEKEDMLHAYYNPIRIYPDVGEDMDMFVGGNRAGDLIEIGVVTRNGEVSIAHAMAPARNKYLR